MVDIEFVAFGEAARLGHEWVGEEHLLIACLTADEEAGSRPDVLRRAYDRDVLEEAARTVLEAEGYRPTDHSDDRLSDPSYHYAIGRAHGLGVAAGWRMSPKDRLLMGAIWDPEGRAASILEAAGSSRASVLEALTGGRNVPIVPPSTPLLRPAEDQALRLGHHYIGDEHVMLALLSSEPDGVAADALSAIGVTHSVFESWLLDRLQGFKPAVVGRFVAGAPVPTSACLELLGRADGLSAVLDDGSVRSQHGLLAYVWRRDGSHVIDLEALSTTAQNVADALAVRGVRLPEAELPEADRRASESVSVPPERLEEVVRALEHRLGPGDWGFNASDDDAWVTSWGDVGLQRLVDEVLSQ